MYTPKAFRLTKKSNETYRRVFVRIGNLL